MKKISIVWKLNFSATIFFIPKSVLLVLYWKLSFYASQMRSHLINEPPVSICEGWFNLRRIKKIWDPNHSSQDGTKKISWIRPIGIKQKNTNRCIGNYPNSYNDFKRDIQTGERDPFLNGQNNQEYRHQDDQHIEQQFKIKQELHDFQPPLDIVDGAARVCDPFFDGINTKKHWCGQFLKDYKPIDW